MADLPEMADLVDLSDKKTQLELARISKSLSRSVHYATSPEERQKIVRNAIRDVANLSKRLDKAPAKIGKKSRSRFIIGTLP